MSNAVAKPVTVVFFMVLSFHSIYPYKGKVRYKNGYKNDTITSFSDAGFSLTQTQKNIFKNHAIHPCPFVFFRRENPDRQRDVDFSSLGITNYIIVDSLVSNGENPLHNDCCEVDFLFGTSDYFTGENTGCPFILRLLKRTSFTPPEMKIPSCGSFEAFFTLLNSQLSTCMLYTLSLPSSPTK